MLVFTEVVVLDRDSSLWSVHAVTEVVGVESDFILYGLLLVTTWVVSLYGDISLWAVALDYLGSKSV